MLEIIQHPSPNYGDRRDGKKISLLILHYTDMLSSQAALDRMCDPSSEVSAHYLIDEDGQIHQMVDEKKRAWHAGISFWHGETDVNSISIGIELANPGHSNGPLQSFPEKQIKSLIELTKDICIRHDIPIANVIGHSDIAPGRKVDPGPLFPWKALSKEKLAIWQNDDLSTFHMANDEKVIAGALAKLGYDVSDIKQAISAFQLRFRPNKYDGEFDQETGQILAALTNKKK
ncbi:N-acetylmuramoyl-L-alanine amidase [Curvivirga aplysinae]|uniref:N-acetylmuramoyl-L-alanine amidase n=1 Tax=Curvivirga aplysinae TaxID=2529852 RepID=UPI0012BD3D76|nr:N-acetylmuramoyl-L-alanine amidase [Curvivirga aplysinae]MTI08458.1 N-acetylmuramoyl-L-alanine amidase [Curvivirga aplysinae]